MKLAAAAITHRLPLYRQPFVYYPASHSISRPLISSSLRLASTAALPVEALQHDAPVYTNVTSRDISEHISLLENSIGGDQYWSDRLREALQDSQTRSKRVSIYGDTLAAPDDIVSALLRTPFSDESAILSFISERKTAPGSSDILKFEFRSSVNRDANRLGLPSGWLRQSGVDLYELTGANALPHLLRSDVVAIVVDPYRLLDVDHVREIPLPILQKSTIIVNGYLPSTHTSETVSSRLRQWLGPTFNGNIVFCNAQLATQAYDILQSGGPSPSPYIVTSYQKLFLASGIGLAQRDLAEAAEHARRPSDTVLQLARRYARDRIKSDTESAQHMLQTVRELRTASHVAATRASHLSVATKQIAGGRIQGSVGSSKSETAARVQSLFQHRLSWLSLLFRLRVDDVSSELEREVGRAFMDVEQQLVYEAGQLYQLQQHLSQKADKVIRRADHPFSSAVLTNRLSTLSLSIPAVESHTLIEPIQRRRAQLVGDIIPLLHAKARWISYQTYMGAAGGVAASWAAYVPPLEIISSSTAVGLGILSVVASLWSGQARWHRSQKAFWHSWDRCSDMLAVDIKAAFASTVEAFVVAKPNAAAEALEQLVQKRLTSLGSIEDRINNINPDKT